MTPQTMRIRIRTRLFALIFACNLVPFFAFLCMLMGTYHVHIDSALILDNLREAILINALLFMAIGLVLIFLVSANLTRPLKKIIRVLQGVQDGVFDKKVRVTSNDEIGYTGGVIGDERHPAFFFISFSHFENCFTR
ncbi:methyl-accepting chemotaxis protein [Desulfococcaceae bacterium HSG9]|nr:methyl-accepting chemotaxis protein [Desulfococcaceae bacterium HSG9]